MEPGYDDPESSGIDRLIDSISHYIRQLPFEIIRFILWKMGFQIPFLKTIFPA